MFKHCVAVAAMLLVVGCSDPHEMRITAENKDNVIKQVGESKQFTADEKKVFAAAYARATLDVAFARAFSEKKAGVQPTAMDTFVGQTVGEVIARERDAAAKGSKQR